MQNLRVKPFVVETFKMGTFDTNHSMRKQTSRVELEIAILNFFMPFPLFFEQDSIYLQKHGAGFYFEQT